jgi:biopolymer transport protein ExbD
MRHASNMGLVVAALVMASWTVHGVEAADINVTLKSDGEHCLVRDVTILCSDLAVHLRDTLKLPRETLIHLRAGRAAPYQSVGKVVDIIKKSGFRYPVAYLTEPESSKGK